MSYIAFLGYVDIIWDIIWWCDMEISYGGLTYDIWWASERKFHGFASPPGGFFQKKQPENPRMPLFENGLLSHFDTGFRIYEKNLLNWYQGHLLRSFLRRAVTHQSKKMKLGPNAIYCFSGLNVNMGIHHSQMMKRSPGRDASYAHDATFPGEGCIIRT